MDAPASPPASDDFSIRSVLSALEQQIRDMRRELDDTLDLIERVRVSCTNIKAKLEATEVQHGLLLKDAQQS